MTEVARTATTSTASESIDDVEVTYDDQLKVNEFSRNTVRLEELTAENKARNDTLETLTDAVDECEMACEDGDIKMLIGEAYVVADEDTAVEHLNAQIEV